MSTSVRQYNHSEMHHDYKAIALRIRIKPFASHPPDTIHCQQKSDPNQMKTSGNGRVFNEYVFSVLFFAHLPFRRKQFVLFNIQSIT